MNFFNQVSLPVKQLVRLLIILVLAAGLQPFLWGYVKTSAQTVRMRQASKDQLAELQSRIAEIEEKRKSQESLLEQLSAVFPFETQTSQLVERLEQLADRQGLLISTKNISVEQDDPKKDPLKVRSMVVSVQVTGRPVQLMQYMELVENAQEVAFIKSWTMVPATGNPALSTAVSSYDLNMNVIFYLQTQKDGSK